MALVKVSSIRFANFIRMLNACSTLRAAFRQYKFDNFGSADKREIRVPPPPPPRLILNYAAQKCEYHRISRASITVNPVIWRGGVPSPILVDPNDNAPLSRKLSATPEQRSLLVVKKKEDKHDFEIDISLENNF